MHQFHATDFTDVTVCEYEGPVCKCLCIGLGLVL